MKTLKEALISKNTIKWASTDKPSKYILIPHEEFYIKMSCNREYIDKSFNGCPYAFVWIIDDDDLVELEQKFYRYSYYLFEAPAELSVKEIQQILEDITLRSQFAENNLIEIKEDELFNLIKKLKRIKRK